MDNLGVSIKSKMLEALDIHVCNYVRIKEMYVHNVDQCTKRNQERKYVGSKISSKYENKGSPTS